MPVQAHGVCQPNLCLKSPGQIHALYHYSLVQVYSVLVAQNVIKVPHEDQRKWRSTFQYTCALDPP
jgi:hypothetical protein